MHLLAGLTVFVLVAQSCGTTPERSRPPSAPDSPAVGPPAAKSPQPKTAIGNPASAACEKRGGHVETVEGLAGQAGVCVFPDESRCDEWRLFRAECEPGVCRASNGICD